jgi:D-alanyl-D-alanine carboxypeptidase/D-alanyl-D-alanine-endopeptidase (penicillin-binding protein 4)
MRKLYFRGGFLAAALSFGCGLAMAQRRDLGQQIQAIVADPGVSRAHWGVAVARMDGTLVYGMNEGQLFQPASNAKLFTTATAMALLGPDTTYTTKIMGRGVWSGAASLKGDVVLVGAGDANLSGRTIPYLSPKDRPKKVAGDMPVDPLRHLAAMADQVVATGLKVVDGDVVGDDTLFPWEPYPSDWSIDDAIWGYGAPVSALTINDNQIGITVASGVNAGDAPSIVVDPTMPPYYRIDASGLTTGAAKSGSHVQMERMIGSRVMRVYGTIATDAVPDAEEVAIEDPAEYAAIALKVMLEARGIRVTGKARAKHRISTDAQGFQAEAEQRAEALKTKYANTPFMGCGEESVQQPTSAEPGWQQKTLAEHQSVSLQDDLVVTNKVSQNLHAELFLHQLGWRADCDASGVSGTGVVRGLLTQRVQIDPDDFIFYDGSGLSGHDLVTPRATAKLLAWASIQPWFAGWRKSLPVGGEDGTLAARFPKAPLKDNLFAKTGTLSEARALSGYVLGASGKTVIFSVMVGNHTPRTTADREAMDRIVAAIAAAN